MTVDSSRVHDKECSTHTVAVVLGLIISIDWMLSGDAKDSDEIRNKNLSQLTTFSLMEDRPRLVSSLPVTFRS